MAGKTVAEQQAEALAFYRVFSTELEALVEAVNTEVTPRQQRVRTTLDALSAAEQRGEDVTWDDLKPTVLAWAEDTADLMERVRPALALAL